jgi:hypothetical protein
VKRIDSWDAIQPHCNGRTFDEWVASIEPMEFYLHYNGAPPSEPRNPSRVKNEIREKLPPGCVSYNFSSDSRCFSLIGFPFFDGGFFAI